MEEGQENHAMKTQQAQLHDSHVLPSDQPPEFPQKGIGEYDGQYTSWDVWGKSRISLVLEVIKEVEKRHRCRGKSYQLGAGGLGWNKCY